jgi:hypothetical protein
MYKYYLGVDLHRRRSYVALMDAKGKIRDQRRLPNDAMPDYVAQLPKNTFAVLEATTNWSYMYDVCQGGDGSPQTGQSDRSSQDQDRQD